MSPEDRSHIRDLTAEVERFQSWAAAYFPDKRCGEWECSYDYWDHLYVAVTEFVDRKPFASWSPEELAAVLYALARDNEMQHLAREIGDRGPELALDLADAAVRDGERDAKWQLAEELKHVTSEVARRERLLLALARDEDEYVRRCSLGALAYTGSPATEELALEAWFRPDDSQEWARMMALQALHLIRSPHLERLLAEAERDSRPYLSAYAVKIRSGTADT